MSVTLYHYTTADGAVGILNSGSIKPSGGAGDARFGNGVYLTSKNPRNHNMYQIARNNFDGQAQVWKSKKNLGKVKCALELELPNSKVEEVSKRRDVWLYEDGNLYLGDYFTGQLFYNDELGYKAADVAPAWYLAA